MAQVESAKDEITATDEQYVFIAAQKREGVFNPEKYLIAHPISFPFLLDEDRRVTKAYGVYHRLGLDAINIAHPATILVGRDGVAKFLYRGDSQFDRVPLGEVLEAVRKLG